jgi:hypothetical protein
MLTWQVPVPVQAPLQPVKAASLPALAVSVTTAPEAKLALHVLPQSMPGGTLVTVPLPLLVTLSRKLAGSKVAVTLRGADIVRLQVDDEPLQAPLQPAKTEPGSATADSATSVPEAKLSLQSGPQSMPAGTLVTVPLPLPARLTSSAKLPVPITGMQIGLPAATAATRLDIRFGMRSACTP